MKVKRAAPSAAAIEDPITALASGSGKRALDGLVAAPSPHALPALLAILAKPPTENKDLVYLLAWAGRLALGPGPTQRDPNAARAAIRDALDDRFAQLVDYLAHDNRDVRTAATLPLAACRRHAVAVQAAFAECERRAGFLAGLRIASSIVARDTAAPVQLVAYDIRPGDPVHYADAIGRQLDGRGATTHELIDAQRYGERSLAKLPWFPRRYASIVRAAIAERPVAEREAFALGVLAERKKIDSTAVEAMFAHRETMPCRDRTEQLASMTLLRDGELTPVQRELMRAESAYAERGMGGTIMWGAFRVPHSAVGRAIVVGESTSRLAASVNGPRGPTPLFVALVDLLAEVILDEWPIARHRAAIDAMLASCAPAQRADLDRDAKACWELTDEHAFIHLFDRQGRPAWPF